MRMFQLNQVFILFIVLSVVCWVAWLGGFQLMITCIVSFCWMYHPVLCNTWGLGLHLITTLKSRLVIYFCACCGTTEHIKRWLVMGSNWWHYYNWCSFVHLIYVFKVFIQLASRHLFVLTTFVWIYSFVQLLVALKVRYSQRITILRGNHESRQV